MSYKIFTPSALQIYNMGLTKLFDEKWRQDFIPDYLESMILFGKTPTKLFERTIIDGMLHYLGSLFFEFLFAIKDDVLFCDINTAFYRCNDLFHLFKDSGVEDNQELFDFMLTIDEVDDILTEEPEGRHTRIYKKRELNIKLFDCINALEEVYEKEIITLKDLYARNYAERAFHDRQICEFISYVLMVSYGEKGYPVRELNGVINYVKIKREYWPAWVKPALMSRERNHCANCGKDFLELQVFPQIDHIVPLWNGGCNDLVNLQLLCSNCNDKKNKNLQLVNSSIPEYLRWKKGK